MILFLDPAGLCYNTTMWVQPYKNCKEDTWKERSYFYAGTAVLLAFSTQQVKADEQHASDQTPENTSAIVATTTSSEAQNTVSEEVELRKVFRQKNTVANRGSTCHTDS